MVHSPNFHDSNVKSVGILDIEAPQTSGGKKVFDWTFKARVHRGPENNFRDMSNEKVTVHMFVTDGEIRFQARSKLFLEKMEDSDINALKRRVNDFFISQITTLNGGIVWEDWLEVVVTGHNSEFGDSRFSALGGNLHIQVNRLKRGVDPATGEALTINCNGIVTKFPKSETIKNDEQCFADPNDPALSGLSGDGLSGWRVKENPEERSYIPATPENLEALRTIIGKLSELRHNLADLLSQDSITERLTDIKWLEHKPKD